jgi:hypothetical protein
MEASVAAKLKGLVIHLAFITREIQATKDNMHFLIPSDLCQGIEELSSGNPIKSLSTDLEIITNPQKPGIKRLGESVGYTVLTRGDIRQAYLYILKQGYVEKEKRDDVKQNKEKRDDVKQNKETIDEDITSSYLASKYQPISSDLINNFRQWIRKQPDNSQIIREPNSENSMSPEDLLAHIRLERLMGLFSIDEGAVNELISQHGRDNVLMVSATLYTENGMKFYERFKPTPTQLATFQVANSLGIFTDSNIMKHCIEKFNITDLDILPKLKQDGILECFRDKDIVQAIERFNITDLDILPKLKQDGILECFRDKDIVQAIERLNLSSLDEFREFKRLEILEFFKDNSILECLVKWRVNQLDTIKKLKETNILKYLGSLIDDEKSIILDTLDEILDKIRNKEINFSNATDI